MHPRLAVNLVAFSKTYGSGFDLTLEQQLDFVEEAGFALFGLSDLQLEEAELSREESIELIKGHRPNLSYLIQTSFFTLDDPSLWEAERERLTRSLEAVAAMGGSYLYGTTGPAGGLSFEEALAAFGEALAPLLPVAERLGVKLLIETTNQLKQEINFLYTLRDLATLAAETGVGLCPDLFHCWREPRLAEVITAISPDSGMVQFSGWAPGLKSMPDRLVPADGEVPYVRIIEAFEAADYGGIYDLEILGPRIGAEGLDAYRRGGTYLTRLLEAAGA